MILGMCNKFGLLQKTYRGSRGLKLKINLWNQGTKNPSKPDLFWLARRRCYSYAKRRKTNVGWRKNNVYEQARFIHPLYCPYMRNYLISCNFVDYDAK
jgi:hypothetical protein